MAVPDVQLLMRACVRGFAALKDLPSSPTATAKAAVEMAMAAVKGAEERATAELVKR